MVPALRGAQAPLHWMAEGHDDLNVAGLRRARDGLASVETVDSSAASALEDAVGWFVALLDRVRAMQEIDPDIITVLSECGDEFLRLAGAETTAGQRLRSALDQGGDVELGSPAEPQSNVEDGQSGGGQITPGDPQSIADARESVASAGFVTEAAWVAAVLDQAAQACGGGRFWVGNPDNSNGLRVTLYDAAGQMWLSVDVEHRGGERSRSVYVGGGDDARTAFAHEVIGLLTAGRVRPGDAAIVRGEVRSRMTADHGSAGVELTVTESPEGAAELRIHGPHPENWRDYTLRPSDVAAADPRLANVAANVADLVSDATRSVGATLRHGLDALLPIDHPDAGQAALVESMAGSYQALVAALPTRAATPPALETLRAVDEFGAELHRLLLRSGPEAPSEIRALATAVAEVREVFARWGEAPVDGDVERSLAEAAEHVAELTEFGAEAAWAVELLRRADGIAHAGQPAAIRLRRTESGTESLWIEAEDFGPWLTVDAHADGSRRLVELRLCKADFLLDTVVLAAGGRLTEPQVERVRGLLRLDRGNWDVTGRIEVTETTLTVQTSYGTLELPLDDIEEPFGFPAGAGHDSDNSYPDVPAEPEQRVIADADQELAAALRAAAELVGADPAQSAPAPAHFVGSPTDTKALIAWFDRHPEFDDRERALVLRYLEGLENRCPQVDLEAYDGWLQLQFRDFAGSAITYLRVSGGPDDRQVSVSTSANIFQPTLDEDWAPYVCSQLAACFDHPGANGAKDWIAEKVRASQDQGNSAMIATLKLSGQPRVQLGNGVQDTIYMPGLEGLGEYQLSEPPRKGTVIFGTRASPDVAAVSPRCGTGVGDRGSSESLGRCVAPRRRIPLRRMDGGTTAIARVQPSRRAVRIRRSGSTRPRRRTTQPRPDRRNPCRSRLVGCCGIWVRLPP